LLVDMARTRESVFAVDTECRIVFLNDRVEALLGYRASEVIGCRCCDALHLAAESGRRTCAMCTRTLANHTSPPSSARFEITATTRAGERVRLRVLAMPAYNATDQLRIVHLVRAISREELGREDEGATLAEFAGVDLHPADEGVGASPGEPRQPLHKHLLTRREREVLQLLAGGLSTANIAAALSISPITARNHATSIIEKLGAKTRLQAVVVASRMGLLTGGTL
jgi:PAS domain S-box-containing protein